jgi:predicted enzyme related to lactoylglutathione lyase
MFTVTKYPQGAFCWADCTSKDAATAKAFYTDALGWSANDLPTDIGVDYTMFAHDGHQVAALSQMSPQMAEQGMPSMWNHYISVEDVEAMGQNITELGGTVIMPAFDVMDQGRMLVFQDPTGAMVSLWQPKQHIGAGLVNTAGAMSWNELVTRDPQTAQDFFSKLFGWEFEKMPDMDYWTFKNNGRMNGGMMLMTDEWEGIPPHWMVYFSVADTDAVLEKITANGGQVRVPAFDMQAGRMAVVADPTGATFSILQSSQPEAWTE